MTGLALASFLAFGALLVLYGANSSELIEALGLGYADLGLLGSSLSLGLGIGIVIAGPLVDRLPRRPLFVGAGASVAAACLALGPGTEFRGLLAATIVIGFGAGFYETVLNALIVETHEDAAPRRLVFIHSAATLAAALTPLFFDALRHPGPVFAALALPGLPDLAWHDTFRLAGALHLLLIAAAWLVPMPASRRAAHASDGGPEKASEDRIAFVAICLATFAYVGVESALTLFVADHARTDLGLDASRAARTISGFWSGLLIGRLAVGLSPRAPGAGTTALLAAVASAIVVSFGLGWLSPPELAMAGAGFFLGGVFPVMIGLAGRALPRNAGLAVGLAGGLGSLGGFVVPWITGLIAGSGGLPGAIASLAGWLGLLVCAATIVRVRRATID
ncbi:MAG: MFS transporter [Myxococcota bacterium]